MSKANTAEASVAGVHRSAPSSHPTLTEPQVLAAHGLAELPLGLTWKDKASRLGIDAVTLRAYRQLPEFQELVIQVARENLRAEIPGAYESLIKGLKAGGGAGARYLELFFKLTGELRDQEQGHALRGWLDAVADCSSDLLVVAIQRAADGAQRAVGTPGSRVVAAEGGVAQSGRMELTAPATPSPLDANSRGSLEL